jgi:hypothetical protein
MVLKDIPEVEPLTNSVDHNHHSDDHGDELTGMYAEDMLGEDRKPILERSVMTKAVEK